MSPPTVPPQVPQRGGWPGVDVVLSGRYRLDRLVGSGGIGWVWRAHDRQLDRNVAVKVLRPELAEHGEGIERFHREVLASVRAVHPNAVRVYDVVTDGGFTYLVSELVDGTSLAAWERPMEALGAAAVGAAAAAALGAAHDQGFVHRRIKPSNVLLDAGGWVRVSDFGVAGGLDTYTPPATEQVHLAGHAAPEQLAGEPIGPAADVYSLGLTLWEAIVGRPAFPGENAASLAAVRLGRDLPPVSDHVLVPHPIDEVLRRATRADPANRFPDGGALEQALVEVTGPRPHEITRRIVGPDGPLHR